MMRTVETALGEAKVEVLSVKNEPEKELIFQARTGGKTWFFNLQLKHGMSQVEGRTIVHPWLECATLVGKRYIRAGEIPFEQKIAEIFKWDPELDAEYFFKFFARELEEKMTDGHDFPVEAALEEAIRLWGEKVAYDLRD